MILPWLTALLGGLTGWFVKDYLTKTKIEEKNTLLSEHKAQSQIMHSGLISKQDEYKAKISKLESELSELRIKSYNQKAELEEYNKAMDTDPRELVETDDTIVSIEPDTPSIYEEGASEKTPDMPPLRSSGLNLLDQEIEMINDDLFREDYDELVDYEERITGLNLQNVRLEKDVKKKSKKYKKLRTRYNELVIQYNKKVDQIKQLKKSIVDDSAVKTIPIEITKEIEVVEKIDFKKLKKILGDKLPTIRSKKIKKASMVKGKPKVKHINPDKKEDKN